MDNISPQQAIWIAVASAFVISFLFSRSTWKQNTSTDDILPYTSPPMIKKMVCDALLIIGSINYIFPAVPLIIRIISSISIPLCILMGYVTNYELIHLTPIPSAKLKRILYWVAPALLLTACLDFLRKDARYFFMEPEPVVPDIVYFFYYMSAFSVMFFIGIIVILLFYNSLDMEQDTSYTTRKRFGMLSFIFIATDTAILGADLFLLTFDNGFLHHELRYLYFIFLILIAATMLIYQLPKAHFDRLTLPMQKRLDHTKVQHQNRKRYLRDIMTKITTNIRYRPDQFGDERIDIEIAQSRYIISTHHPRTKPITVQSELNDILECLQKNITYTAVGNAIAQRPRGDANKHNIALARRLQRLERNGKMAKSIPKLPGAPLLGNLHEFRNDRLNLFMRVYHECGNIGQYRVGPLVFVHLHAPEDIHTVLVERPYDFQKFPLLRRYLVPVLGNGLFTSENDTHKRQRRLVAPAFQHRKIASYADIMTNYTLRLEEQWSDGMIVDIAQEMTRLTMWIAGKTLFDAEVLDEATDLGKAIAMAAGCANAEMSTLLHFPPSWPTPRNVRFHRATQRLDATIYRIISERRRSRVDRNDVLSMLLLAQDEDDGSFMTDQQVRDEVMTLFTASHETTAAALTWTWYLLAQHPHIYTRMQEEVATALAGRPPTLSDLPKLPYTLQVFKEALRIYPPAYILLGREVPRPMILSGYHVPAGAIIGITPYVLHRQPEYFPDPERFDPDRFTPEAEQRIPRYAYLPFSTGARVCLGSHFALMEGQLVLATLAQHATFELVDGQRIVPEPGITLRPRNGINMIVHRKQTTNRQTRELAVAT